MNTPILVVLLHDFASSIAMADPSSDYHVLEELGSQLSALFTCFCSTAKLIAGGSFGVVFKGVDKKSGELVALKLVGLIQYQKRNPQSNSA